MNYIVIGNGVAGITAAQTLRAGNPDAAITVYTNELQTGFYKRKDLARQLANGGIHDDTIYVETSDSLKRQGIKVIYDPVLRVFARLNQVLLNHSIRDQYDRLLIASGTTPRLLDVPGYALLGVHQAWSYEDFTFIDNWVTELRRYGAIVVGGGVLGMDTAYALNARGVPTTLLVRESALGSPWLSSDLAGEAATKLREMGVMVRFNTTVAAFESEDGKILDQIVLTSGDHLPARLVICCIGVTANTEFLEDSGIEIDDTSHAILVNKYFQTNIPNIYAAGACAQVDGTIAYNWSIAEAQGRSAALHMLDQTAMYEIPEASSTVLPLILQSQNTSRID